MASQWPPVPGSAPTGAQVWRSFPQRRFVSLSWTSGAGALCHICNKRASVVRERSDEPALCPRCFAAHMGWPLP
jgi:hypothetical protein